MNELVTDKTSRIRKDVCKEMGSIGLLLHTRLNSIISDGHISPDSTQSLTVEEEEVVGSLDQLRMNVIPNKRQNFVWFLCSRMLRMLNVLQTKPHLNDASPERVFPTLPQLKHAFETLGSKVPLKVISHIYSSLKRN